MIAEQDVFPRRSQDWKSPEMSVKKKEGRQGFVLMEYNVIGSDGSRTRRYGVWPGTAVHDRLSSFV